MLDYEDLMEEEASTLLRTAALCVPLGSRLVRVCEGDATPADDTTAYLAALDVMENLSECKRPRNPKAAAERAQGQLPRLADGKVMTREEAFECMRILLTQLLVDAEKLARQARNPAGRIMSQDKLE
jgi:hypothetical protein